MSYQSPALLDDELTFCIREGFLLLAEESEPMPNEGVTERYDYCLDGLEVYKSWDWDGLPLE